LVQSKAELLSLQQLRCFCAALELGSFTAAADALRVSQPAVAEQVRKLEQALGADLFVRAGRGVVATDAGRAFAEHATRSLRAVEDAADSVGELTALRSGTVAVGIFGEPSAWRMDELVAAFLRRHPNVSVRLVGRNSSAIVERVRRGELEAGVVLLPIDDDKLDVCPIVRDEVLYVSASPERTRKPATIEQLATTPLVFYDAESGDRDPIRRQLAERAQALGVRLQPKVEVELKDIALRLVAAGIGDSYLPTAYTYAPYYPQGLSTASFSPALYDTFAIITRPAARLSPGVRELLTDVDTHMRAIADEFDGSRVLAAAGGRPSRGGA
jgi:DNA-binding transcriptional LysR family regulator